MTPNDGNRRCVDCATPFVAGDEPMRPMGAGSEVRARAARYRGNGRPVVFVPGDLARQREFILSFNEYPKAYLEWVAADLKAPAQSEMVLYTAVAQRYGKWSHAQSGWAKDHPEYAAFREKYGSNPRRQKPAYDHGLYAVRVGDYRSGYAFASEAEAEDRANTVRRQWVDSVGRSPSATITYRDGTVVKQLPAINGGGSFQVNGEEAQKPKRMGISMLQSYVKRLQREGIDGESIMWRRTGHSPMAGIEVTVAESGAAVDALLRKQRDEPAHAMQWRPAVRQTEREGAARYGTNPAGGAESKRVVASWASSDGKIVVQLLRNAFNTPLYNISGPDFGGYSTATTDETAIAEMGNLVASGFAGRIKVPLFRVF